MSISALVSKLTQMRELINVTVGNKTQLQQKLSQSTTAAQLLVAQYLNINIEELSRIRGDLDFVTNQMQKNLESEDASWRISLNKMVELITATIDNKTGLLRRLQQISTQHPVAELLEDNIKELQRVQADLSESIVLANV